MTGISKSGGFDPRRVQRAQQELERDGMVIPSPSLGRAVASRWHQGSHPAVYDKAQALRDAVNLSAHWCIENDLVIPAYCVTEAIRPQLGNCSLWTNGGHLIRINAPLCPLAGKMHAHNWPGGREDFTVAGIVAHETGHLLHHSRPEALRGWRPGEPINDYEYGYTFIEPKYGPETFAETLRLFILNPSFLRVAAPTRYSYLTDVLGLVAVVTTPWEEILAHAPHEVRTTQWTRAA